MSSSSTEKQRQCREILTKAVCGKGRKYSTGTHSVTPSHHSLTILGCWVMNHVYKAVKVGETVEVNGSYEVNIWYSYNNNTETTVQKETVKFNDSVPLSYYDSNCRGDVEVTARVSQEPHAVEAKLAGGKIIIIVEREYSVEVVGETKLCVVVCDKCNDDYKEEFYVESFADPDEFDEFDPDAFID
ncbi:outer spore coat protein CotE [Aneurinibacillus sp. Ricciae_BoGa-3]|uniref:outer spore coat protein CotE n=1 Tax=Aneurinibacillus sp. Ricciae_BoGa-3 TaxID=3022697 RepID=UPI002340C7F5|nr:outer spore coat protein CotE [Aneurinibacillus sp. Ricciae_BoGa-3]WCK56159.1 outer spore coat protein CotE [Aneurinibacillus sp. Ricciae_BoGa-3]